MFCQTIQSFFELHSLNSLFFHFFDHMTALCVRAYDLIALVHHETSAFLAVDPCRFLPGHKFTFRIVFTTVIFSAFFRLFDHYFFSTERTGNSCFFQIRLRRKRNPGRISRNFPCGPYFTTIFLPHCSQTTSVTSS